LGAAFPWLLALRYLLSRWVNVLGVLGVAVAVWALIVVPAIFSGFIADIHSETRRTSPDLLLTSLPNDSDYRPLRAALVQDPDVVATAPRLRHYGVLYPRRGGNERTLSVDVDFAVVGTNFAQLIGIDPQAEAKVTSFAQWVKRGRDVSFGSLAPALDELGANLEVPGELEREARLANGLPVPANGQWRSLWPGMLLSSRRLKMLWSQQVGYPLDVVAVAWNPGAKGAGGIAMLKRTFALAGAYQGSPRFDDVTALVAIEPLRTMLGETPYAAEPIELVTDVAIRCRDGMTDEQLGQLAPRLLDRVRPLLPEGSAAEVLTWRGQNQVILDAVDLERAMTTVVLFAVMLIAAFLIYATLHMMVTQKTKDIGILTALGGAPGEVGAVFTRCGFAIGLCGSGLGVLGGVGSLHVLNPFNDWMERTFGVSIFNHKLFDLPAIPWRLDPLWLLLVAVLALLMALFVAWLPARRAAAMQPVKTLAYE
jgi:ABC-type lipoprotein release transport system permease subunit